MHASSSLHHGSCLSRPLFLVSSSLPQARCSSAEEGRVGASEQMLQHLSLLVFLCATSICTCLYCCAVSGLEMDEQQLPSAFPQPLHRSLLTANLDRLRETGTACGNGDAIHSFYVHVFMQQLSPDSHTPALVPSSTHPARNTVRKNPNRANSFIIINHRIPCLLRVDYLVTIFICNCAFVFTLLTNRL